MSENLRDEIEAAILANFNPPDDKHASWWINPHLSADAVLAVVGPELDRLRAEVERLRARGERFREQRDGEKAQRRRTVAFLVERAEAAEAERDDLRARLAKVEALADEWDAAPNPAPVLRSLRSALRAALAFVPEPSESEPAPRDCPDCDLPTDRSAVTGCHVDPLGTDRVLIRTFGGYVHLHHLRITPLDSEPAPDADREAGGE